ncbi:MAG: bifunctional nuclease family protein [Bacteroidales bacterium]|nr:bifunctional nuclease family protein [Bacteroidales bacterium]
MMKKIKLNVVGLSYSETHSGAYALILEEENGQRRIPIIIGSFEAQAIAIQLEKLKPPRPLTHDLFVTFASAFNIDLIEVNIYKLEEGVFYSNLIFQHNDEQIIIDSRTSDAIALALRFDCPIYTTPTIIDHAGINLNFEDEEEKNEDDATEINKEKETRKNPYAKYTIEELEKMMQAAIENEEYEKASAIRDELNRRKKDF